MSRLIALSLILAILLPLQADAARMKVTRPRGRNYQNASSGKDAKRNPDRNAALQKTLPSTKVTQKFSMPAIGMTFKYPDDWSFQMKNNGPTKLAASSSISHIGAWKDTENDPWISVVAMKTTKNFSLPELDAKFERDSELSGDMTATDYYIPGMSNLTSSTITVSGLPARRYEYKTSWHSLDQTGVTIYLVRDGWLLEFWFRSAPETLSTATEIFENILGSVSFTAPKAGGSKKDTPAKLRKR